MFKKVTLFTALVINVFQLSAQTQFWSDTFEDVGAPSSGTRASSYSGSSGGPPATRYFMRTNVTSINASAPGFSMYEGSKFWAAEDVDAAPSGVANQQSSEQNVSWASINITGKTGLSFKGLFATTLSTVWDHGTSTTLQDYCIVEARIDLGAWVRILSFQPNSANLSNGALSLDTNGDGLGDGAALGAAFTEFSANISGTGTQLDIRCTSSANSLAEELGFDNFRLFETPSCTAPIITANPPNRAICAGNNTTFAVSATGATAYQWQVDQTGGGTYTNLSNVAPYSGVTTSVLTITGATAGMTGYRYRAVAINGVATCSTSSNYGTLTISNIATSGSQTNVSCFGGSNGNAAVSATGGIGGYTYSWTPSGGTGSIATGLTSGSYACTVTDGIGCTNVRNFTITQPTNLAGTTVVTNVSCFGGTNGSINLTPSGGTPGYTFNWGGGVTTEDRTGLAAGNYSVTITDANACTRVVNATVTQPTSNVAGTTVVTNVSCFGGSNGAINLTPTGGTGPYTFNWLPSGPTTEDRTGLTAGTYTVQITDVNGCTGTVNATVTQPTNPASGTTVVTNVSCFGGSNGAINLTPTGGTGPYTFNWLPSGPTTEDRTGLTVGTYTVQITDNNGCTGTVNATLTQPTNPVSGTTVVTNVSCFGGSNGAINLTPTGGTGPYTFNWLPSGPTTEDRTGLTAGTYTVQITDNNGCTGTVNATLTQPTNPVSGTTVVTNVSCFGGSNGAINLTPTGGTGPYTFNWLPSGPTTEDRTGLIAGTYTVQVTDINGCTGTINATLTQPTSPVSGTRVVTNVSCFGGSNGAINLTPNGGTGPYTFNWLPSGPTTEDRTGLIAGTYTVQVTDVNGCTGTVNATVTQPTNVVSGTTVVTNVSCFGGTNGAINLTPTGGTPGYTFNWGGGVTTEDRTGLIAGTYSVQITDMNGCTGIVNATVTQPTSNVSGTTVVTNVSCFGGSNGAINLTPTGGTGPYTFNWLPSGPTTEDRTGLTSGTYTVQITDNNGCTAIVNATVTQPTNPVSGTTVVTNVSCFGGSNGAINLTPTGGTGPYTFNWLPSGPTTEDRTGLTSGTYTVQITDNNGCTGTVNATVTQPTNPVSGTTVVTNVSCFGGSNSAINLTPNGGTPGYTFNWGGGVTTEDRTGLAAGNYSVTITDANGCTGTVNATVTQPTALTANSTASSILCNGGMGSVTVTATGGTTSYSGVGTFTAMAGTQTYTVTDANGCSATTSITISEPTVLTANATAGSILCNGGMTTVTVATTGGTTTYTGVGTYTAMAGTQTYTVTDANGCSATTSVTITEPAILTANSTASSILCNGDMSTVTVTATGGTTSYTGVGTFTAMAGTQTYTVTDFNGCAATTSVSITEPSAITSAQSFTLCNGQSLTVGTSTYSTAGTFTDVIASQLNGCDSTITTSIMINALPNVTVNSGAICAGESFTMVPNGAATYTYSNGSDIITPSSTDSYTVTGTDANGCVNSAVSSVTVNTLPTISVISASICGGATGTVIASGADTYTWSTGSNTDNVTDSPLATTVYTVNGTSLEGCLGAEATATITVGAAPSIVVNSESICAGNSATLTANGVTTYTWSTGETTNTIIVTPTTNTVYTVTGDLTGCGVSANSSSTVNVNALPILVATTNNTLLCTGETATLSVSGASTYTWSTTETTSGIVISPTTQTTYTVDGTDVNGCSNTTTITQDVSLCTGITNVTEALEAISVYPNPSSGIFYIELTTDSKVIITNTLGQTIVNEEMSIGKHEQDIHNQADGIYFVKVIQNNKQQTIKVIKK